MKPNFGGSWEIPSQTLAAAGGSFSHYSIAFSADMGRVGRVKVALQAG